MHKRWISTLFVCIILLSMCVHPSAARLSEGLINLSSLNVGASGGPTRMYQVEPGDNLWSIAKHNEVSLQALMTVNRLNQNSILNVGDMLRIPTGNTLIHVVKSGETMWSIADHYNVAVDTLENANADMNPECLNIGDKIRIPSAGTSQQASYQPSRGLFGGGLLAWPISGTITSAFGWRRSGFHHGLDIASRIGTPIKAAADGKVVFVGWKNVYGRTVIVEHHDGKRTLYAHTQKIMVNNNQRVIKGQTIATVGMSGRTTGPHLHFEVKMGDKVYDPWRYLVH